jgi:outer membrane protein assembly factor BamB
MWGSLVLNSERESLMKHFFYSICALSLFTLGAFAQESNWNQFRGPNHDNFSASTGLANSWGEGGPKLLWQVETLGIGFSNLCIYGGQMYTLGDVGDQCFVFALESKTGKDIWKQPIGKSGTGRAAGGAQAANNSVGPLGTPACDGETVYALSQYGIFAAFDAKDGKERWRKDIVEELGANIMAPWAYSTSPILDGDKILLQIGGKDGSLAAFDKTGKMLWVTKELQFPSAYTSVVPLEIGGVKQYLLLTGSLSGPSQRDAGFPSALAGISPADGKVLWQTDFPGKVAVCSDPVLCGDVVMASCGYNVGSGFYRISKEGNAFTATQIHFDQSLISHHGGIVAVKDHFYLLADKRGLVCVEAKTGNIAWENRSVGKGSLTYADGKLILRSEIDDGTMAMVEATPEGYKELGRFDQPERSGKSSWTYPVIVDGKMYIRDQGLLLCYDLK